MRLLRLLCFPLLLATLLLTGCKDKSSPGSQTLSSGVSSSNPAGYWEGSIKLPTMELGVHVSLDHQVPSPWSGIIDIPAQNLRGFVLSGVAVSSSQISFEMAGIPGDPKFSGALAEDGKTIRGTFTQGGQSFPFSLDRKPRPAGTSGSALSKGIPGKGLAGHWLGSLKASPVIELRIAIEISPSDAGGFTGVFISLDQGKSRIPLTTVSEKSGNVHLEAKSIGGTFDGKLSNDGSEIPGTWKQNGNSLPITFFRTEAAAALNRPQDPKPPFPYDEVEVTVPNEAAGIQLAGTLTIPRGAGPHPAVVLLTGSGPQDRDETLMGHRPFLVLADRLSRDGIAVLRFDDRGVGKSGGKFATATHLDFTDDALACVEFLKQRHGIAPNRIGLIGHSEGGIVGPLAAVKRPDDIAFVVLLAGVGIPMDELLIRQGEDVARVMGASDEIIAKNTAAQRELYPRLKVATNQAAAEALVRETTLRQVAGLTEAQKQAAGVTDAMLEGQIQSASTPWFRTLLAYDPNPVLKKVRCPILALNGSKDIQVAAAANLAGIRDALAAGGNQRVKTVELPGLNHLFQTCTTGAISEYGQIEETMAPAVLQLVSDWIREQANL